ncbi:glycosyltransferase family 4 protein [Flavobacterium sp.]|uniref:glycosyltransferase family 4 protein n=1 Tax=Flavobacterium sp. TaxID=239 RepID=UPI003751A0C9
MKTVNILVDCHVFDGNLQGTTTYLKGLYQEMIKDKTKMFFLAAFNVENLQTVFGIHSNVVYLRYSSQNKFFRLLFDIPKLITKNKIDYAHFQYIVPPIKKCNYIVTIHDVLFLDFPQYFPFLYQIKNKFLFKYSANKADVVLTVSQYSKEKIEEHFGISNVKIISNAIDLVYFEKYNKESEVQIVKNKFNIENYFLFVSRWEPRKNHHTLLKSFVENSYYKKYKMVFVGDDAIENKSYNQYYNSLDNTIKQQVVRLKNIGFQDLIHLVRASSVSIYPSFAEGFGIPPLETIAAGIPTVCSNTTAMSDFSFIGNCLFDPTSIEDLNLKIENALNDNLLQEKQNTVKIKYNWELSAQKLIELL